MTKKENANPIVYSVPTVNCRATEDVLIGTASINRFRFHPSETTKKEDYDESQIRFLEFKTPEERSTHMALASCASLLARKSKKKNNDDMGGIVGDPLGLLRLAGFDLSPSPKSSLLRQPQPFYSVDLTKNESLDQENQTKLSRDPINTDEIFDMIRNIQDPEHPLTLEQLNVVNRNHIKLFDLLDALDPMYETDEPESNIQSEMKRYSYVDVRFTPTIPHCSMATLIGLCIRVKLLRSLPSRFKVSVRIKEGTHSSEHAINRQLNDKERVRAALENEHLLGVVNKCIGNGMKGKIDDIY